MNDKLKEALSVLACVCLLIGLGFYTGFFNNFGLSDLQKVFKGASNDLSQINKVSIGKNTKINIENVKTSRIKDYRANNIPPDVMKGYELNGYWENIFGSDKKVIFYVYDEMNRNRNEYSSDFHNKISQSFDKGKMSRYYDFQATSYSYFQNYYAGITGQTKICNSIEECNRIKNKSTSKAAMQMFLDRCAKGFCIIYPKKREFVIVRTKDANESLKMLNALKSW